jgi:hypothetical protein
MLLVDLFYIITYFIKGILIFCGDKYLLLLIIIKHKIIISSNKKYIQMNLFAIIFYIIVITNY